MLTKTKDSDRLLPLQRQASELTSEIDMQQSANNATLKSLGNVNIFSSS